MAQTKIQFILSIDTEEEWDWDGPFPGQGAQVSNINELPAFHAFCQDLGIRPTYFTDYAVLDNPHSANIIKSLLAQNNCELGAHLHPWVNPPFYGPVSEKESHIVNLPIEQVRSKLEALLALMQDTLSLTPRAFRSGRWGINGECLDLLVENGFQIDSSIYPFFRNDYFSCESAPVTPYWPDLVDTNKASATQRNIYEMPVTAGYNQKNFYLSHRLHNRLSSIPFSWFRLNGIFWHLGLLRKIYLSPELHNADDMIKLITTCLKRGQTLLHMYMHSSSLIENATGLSNACNARESISETITEVIEHLNKRHHVEFQTISEANQRLVSNQTKNTRATR